MNDNLGIQEPDDVEGVGRAFERELKRAKQELKEMAGLTGKMKDDAKGVGSSLTNSEKPGGGRLGLGTMTSNVLNNFSKGQLAVGAAVIGGGTFMSMAPNTMSAVAQRLYADSVAGLSGMKAQPLIRQSNRLVNGATSAMGPTAAAANIFYQGGYNASSLSSKNIMSQLGGMSAITGQTNEQAASTMAGMNGMTFLRMGVRIRDAQGNLLPMNQIVNSVWTALYGGRKVTLDQAALLLNPRSRGYQTLQILTGGDGNLQQAITMALITRARKGSNLTKGDLGSAQNALTAMGVGGESPLRANFRFQAGQNAALQATEGGLVGGYNTSLNVVGALNQGFADLASALGPVTSGLMGLKGILQTFPNAGNMGSTVSNIGSTVSGIASSAMNYALMSRVMGIGRFAGGSAATAGGASLAGSALSGAGKVSMFSRMGGLLGKAGKFGGKGIPILGAALSAYGGYQSQKSHQSFWGGLLSAAGSGATFGGVAGGIATGGAGIIPGALLGGLISGGGYLLGRGIGALTGSGGPDDEHHHGFGMGGDNTTGPSQAKFNLPVPKGTKITSPYGKRSGKGGISTDHKGIDFGVRENSNVMAAANGVVTEVGNGGGYGNYVIIKHGDKSTLYAHLNSALVKVGDQVSGGQVIAKSGGRKGAPGAGSSTGPHLHFEVRDNGGRAAGGRINPAGFFGKTANFVSNFFKSGINFAKKAANFLTTPFRKAFGAFSNMFRHHSPSLSPTSLTDLNSPELRSLLQNDLTSGRVIGYDDISKYMENMQRRSLSITSTDSGGKKLRTVGNLNNKDEAVSSHIAGGSKAGLIKLLQRAGFKGKSLETAFAVVLAESRGNARDYNPRGLDKSYGLFQINMNNDDPRSPNMGIKRLKQFGLKNYSELYNPDVNARAAYQVSNGGKWWKPWSTYNDGTFLKYLDDAKRAKAEAHIGGPYGSDGMSSNAGTRTKAEPHKVDVKLEMHMTLMNGGQADAEKVFQHVSRKLKAAMEEKEISFY